MLDNQRTRVFTIINLQPNLSTKNQKTKLKTQNQNSNPKHLNLIHNE